MSLNLFQDTFGEAPAVSGWTPGRVNLIGEHIDYNGGAVLPMALPLGVDMTLTPIAGDLAQIVSAQFEGVAVRQLSETASHQWSDYILGALAQVSPAQGWHAAIDSSIPFGSGLSSSAAVSVGALRLAREALHLPKLSAKQIALNAQSIENNFIGVPCGVMDQMAVSALAPGEAMLLDTQTLAFEQIAIPEEWCFVVHHSGVHRELSDGRYAERRATCFAAAEKLGVNLLCQAPISALEIENNLTDIERQRAAHAITEHARVIAAKAALDQRNLSGFGKLMIESHASMRDDFDITTPAIDQLVDVSVECGAIGARMTGGGFGGCIVSLVDADHKESWRKRFEERAAGAKFIC